MCGGSRWGVAGFDYAAAILSALPVAAASVPTNLLHHLGPPQAQHLALTYNMLLIQLQKQIVGPISISNEIEQDANGRW